jgi:Xaa-Pro aminopeptidase
MGERARPDWARRVQSTIQTLRGADVDALVVSHPQNVRYLCGFTGSTGWLVVSPAGARLVTDGRYTAFVRQQIASGRQFESALDVVELGYDQALGSVLTTLEAKRVAFEGQTVTVAGLRRWQQLLPGIDWQPTDDLVEKQRLVKDAVEIQCLRDGGRRLASVAQGLGRIVATGKTELDVARAIDAALERVGFERPAFETIVASGPNSAFPHARPTDRRLGAGDLVVLDFGGVLDGYCVDLTRMAAVGRINSEARLLVDVVLQSQRAAIDAVRAGVTTASVDHAARSSLERRGLGPAFSHGTGHGLGLDVHEAPRISRAESGHVTTLVAGMVFTIEPGAYVEGVGGVRVEDDVLVTTDGCEVLTECARELLVV